MTDTSIVGLDISLNGTGVAVHAAGVRSLYVISPTSVGGQRLDEITNRVETACVGATLAVIEDYSYGSRNQLPQLGEIGGCIRRTLYVMGVPYTTITPQGLKKFATGRSAADKIAMVVAARDRLGYGGTNADEADACWLLEVGLHLTGSEYLTALPQAHLEALKKVTRPWE